MSTNVAKAAKVAIIGNSGTYGAGILARADGTWRIVIDDPSGEGSSDAPPGASA